MATIKRDDLLLVRLNPPLNGRMYGFEKGRNDIAVIAPKWVGRSLFPVSEWPLAVHVCYMLINDPELRDTLYEGEFRSVAWGEVIAFAIPLLCLSVCGKFATRRRN